MAQGTELTDMLGLTGGQEQPPTDDNAQPLPTSASQPTQTPPDMPSMFPVPPSGSQIASGPAAAVQDSIFPKEKRSAKQQLQDQVDEMLDKAQDTDKTITGWQKMMDALKREPTASQKAADIHQQIYGTGLKGAFNQLLNAAGNVGDKDYKGTFAPILEQQNKETEARHADLQSMIGLASQQSGLQKANLQKIQSQIQNIDSIAGREKVAGMRAEVQKEANRIREKHYDNEDARNQDLLELRQKTEHPNDMDAAIEMSGGRDDNGNIADSAKAMDIFTRLQKARALAKPNNDASLTPQAIKGLATVYTGTGELPGGMGMTKQKTAVLNEVFKDPQAIQNLIGNKLQTQADATAMKKAQTVATQVAQFEGAAKPNLINFLNGAIGDKEKGIPGVIDTGSPILNHVFRGAEREVFGDTAQARFDAARVVAYTEVSKILSGAMGNSPVSDSGRKEVEALLKGSYTIPQLVEVSKLLMQDMDNRAKANKAEVDRLAKKVNARVNPESSGTPVVGGTFNGGKILKVTPIQ